MGLYGSTPYHRRATSDSTTLEAEKSSFAAAIRRYLISPSFAAAEASLPAEPPSSLFGGNPLPSLTARGEVDHRATRLFAWKTREINRNSYHVFPSHHILTPHRQYRVIASSTAIAYSDHLISSTLLDNSSTEFVLTPQSLVSHTPYTMSVTSINGKTLPASAHKVNGHAKNGDLRSEERTAAYSQFWNKERGLDTEEDKANRLEVYTDVVNGMLLCSANVILAVSQSSIADGARQ